MVLLTCTEMGGGVAQDRGSELSVDPELLGMFIMVEM